MEIKMNDLSSQKMLADARQLLGQVCWAAASGEGTGSVVNFHLGQKIPRQRPIPNPHLHKDLQLNKGEFGIMVYCAWRLEQGSIVICGSGESNSNEGSMIKGLDNLTGRNIKSLSIFPPAFDMTIGFENECVLKVFCDMTNIKKEKNKLHHFCPK
jgi:hypothetical protein